VITLHLYFVWLSEQTVTFALYVINRLFFITEMESVYRAVRTESSYNTDTSHTLKVKPLFHCTCRYMVYWLWPTAVFPIWFQEQEIELCGHSSRVEVSILPFVVCWLIAILLGTKH